jgi:nicotinamide-nucleotide amidase
VVIITGGLGSTGDDVTRDVVCSLLNLELRVNEEYSCRLKQHWLSRGRGEPPAELFYQAAMPVNAVILNNRFGSAPGLWLKSPDNKYGKDIFLLPGPPEELEPMFSIEVMPRLEAMRQEQIFTEHFMVINASELTVEQNIKPIIAGTAISPAYCASYEGVKVFLSASDAALLHEKTLAAVKVFGDAVAANRVLSLAEDIAARLLNNKLILATAESCTGGMIAAAITDLPGSSQLFSGAVVAYSNQIKINVLAVPEQIIAKYGAVSSECVSAMVEGICKKFGTDVGIAVSGVAGPDGGTPQKPIGLVFIGVKLRDKQVIKEYRFRGSRAVIRRRAVIQSLLMLRGMLVDVE